jgi:hypothetical protein
MALSIQRRLPRVGRHATDRDAFPLAQIAAHQVVHPPPRLGVEGGDVVDQAMGSAGTVAVTSRSPPMPGGDLRDGSIEHLKMIDYRVRTGTAGSQGERQRLAGVVTPGHQRVVASPWQTCTSSRSHAWVGRCGSTPAPPRRSRVAE